MNTNPTTPRNPTWCGIAAGVLGALLSMILLYLGLTLWSGGKTGDFTTIVSNIYFAAIYGAVVGAITHKLFKRICPVMARINQ